MSDLRWWERFPTVWEAEQASLDGLKWSRDEPAVAAGIMRLNLLEVDIGGEAINLVVTYPDLYPYFRFEVDAPGLSLPYHQNPFLKNLCLIGRATRNWYAGETIGDMIRDQLPRVLEAARAATPAEADALEEHQAEPFSEYYQCMDGSMVVVESAIQLPPDLASGTFRIGMRQEDDTLDRPLRGALLSVDDTGGRPLWRASDPIAELYSAGKLSGIWQRLESPPPADGPEVYAYLEAQDARFKSAPRNLVNGGAIRLVGALAPVESAWRAERRDVWIFAWQIIPNPKGGPGPSLLPLRKTF